MKSSICGVITALFLLSCGQSDLLFIRDEYHPVSIQKEANPIIQQLYLIGDVGEGVEQSAPALQLLKKEMEAFPAMEENTTVVFLGDNIYPRGMHAKEHPLREEDEKRINAQLDIVKDFKGEVFFIPGNHDWQQGGKEGFEFNKRQEDYIQDYLDRKVYEPSDGCAGPDEIKLSDKVTLIIIDTQWWLHKYKKGRGEKDDCKGTTKEDFVLAFEEVLKKNRDKHVIVAGHHPMYSNGEHGGYYSWRDNLFPLTHLKKGLYIPLPLLGSIYPFYRSFFGNIQDISHPIYQELKEALTSAMNQYDNVVYVCGHEHNLQYFLKESTHYVVSGSGSKVTHIGFNKEMDFGAEKRGFAKIEVYQNGSVLLRYYNAEETGPAILFEKKLYQKDIREFSDMSVREKVSYKGQFKEVTPDSTMTAGPLKRIFFGDLNRDLWTQTIRVPVLDIHYQFGGLKPVKKGGGQQTISLEMRGGDGKRYKLRGIKKSADFLVEKRLRGTITQDVVYDGIAGSHPYASLVMPPMLHAAGLYYTQPELVYIPKDSILGDFLEEFGGMFALLEVHPDDDMSDQENFGFSKEVVSSTDAIEELQQHQDHKVDLAFTVKSRLMDMLVGDWDRHDDQWRWASFKEKGETTYRPIPRDRDQVFFQFDGLVMSIANRKWLLRRFQPFREDVRDIAGLNFNARYFDRFFLAEADRELWKKQARALQKEISDSVIAVAIAALPEEAQEINGEELKRLLSVRREKLEDFAMRYYDILARTVDVTGTSKEDYFEVKRIENGDVEVNVYPRKKGKKQEEKRFYHRIFKRGETKEIRLYGMGNDDEYEIEGKVHKSILVRIIAGDRKDNIKDYSRVRGLTKKTRIYEVEGEQDNTLSKESWITIKKEGDEVFYDRKAFKYDVLFPMPSIGYNLNDGFYIGPGVSYTKYGFNRYPYKSRQDISINYARRAEGVNIYYSGDFIKLLAPFDLGLGTTINLPEVYQYYGLGNETKASSTIIGESDVRINNYQLESAIRYSSKRLSSRLSLGFKYQFMELEEVAVSERPSLIGENEEFASLSIDYQFQNLDNKANPAKGLSWDLNLENTVSTKNDEVNFFKLKTAFSIYMPVHAFRKQTTIAMRVGYTGNVGDYHFYQANFLSGIRHLRGIPRNRFAGESVTYGNLELRKSFLKVRNYLAPFDFGMLFHGDIGRVWVDDDYSDRWHNSFGAGVFLNILDFFALTASYSISDVDRLFNVGTNFYF
jgi:UDP-2,3-diacylglucosamine pyrophosphatase LpxH